MVKVIRVAAPLISALLLSLLVMFVTALFGPSGMVDNTCPAGGLPLHFVLLESSYCTGQGRFLLPIGTTVDLIFWEAVLFSPMYLAFAPRKLQKHGHDEAKQTKFNVQNHIDFPSRNLVIENIRQAINGVSAF